jgi:hypothetical protein
MVMCVPSAPDFNPMAAATDSSVAIFIWLLIRVHLIKPKAAVNYSGVFLFTRDEKSLRNKASLCRVYQKKVSRFLCLPSPGWLT